MAAENPQDRDARAELIAERSRWMENQLARWIPVALVLISSGLLIVLPRVFSHQTGRHLKQITQVAEPARRNIEELRTSLALEVASLKEHALTGSPTSALKYTTARQAEVKSLAALERQLEAVGPAAMREIRRLKRDLFDWHAGQDAMLREPRDAAALASEAQAREQQFERVLTSTELLNEHVLTFQSRHRFQIGQIERFEGTVTALLALLAISAAAFVAILSRRYGAIVDQLRRRANEEVAFRNVASSLTGATAIDDVLREVTRSATEVTRADGVYVEQIVAAERSVVVVASSGTRVPPVGVTIPYPGSLTEEIIEKRLPLLVTDLAGIGHAIAPYLQEHCLGSELLVIPLLSENNYLGSLVLLNSRMSGRLFSAADINRAKAVGALASLALRRVVVIEEQREARRAAEESRAAAERAVRARDEVLGIVSHDLRNPLTRVSLAAAMLGTSSDKDSLAAQIQLAVHQMERLITDLLDVTRIEHGNLSVKLKALDAAAIAQEARDSLRPVAAEKGVTVDCHLTEGLGSVSGDHDRLMQLFSNLVGNAIKFTPAGGTVTISAVASPTSVVFSIADEGSGIPEHDLPHVFERFWQAKKTAHLGAGLGLTISKGIVESHGGSISVRNGPGGGAVFTFTLPKL